MLCAALFGIAAVLLGAEAAARVFRPDWAPTHADRADFWAYDELLGWAHRPGTSGRFNHRDFSVQVRINSTGLRDNEYPLERTDKHRMLVLGDSFAWGFGVEHSERFSEILERRYPDWEIINASVSGYGTDQQYLYLREHGARFGPDVVLLLFDNSDFENNVKTVQYWYNKPCFVPDGDGLVQTNTPVPESGPRQRLDRFFLGRTYLWARVYEMTLSRLVPRQTFGEVMIDFNHSQSYKELVAERLLDQVKGFCRKAGFRLVLIATPLVSGATEALEEWARRREVPFLALERSLAAASQAREVTFEHDHHWNREGHAVVAATIERFLVDLEILGRPGDSDEMPKKP